MILSGLRPANNNKKLEWMLFCLRSCKVGGLLVYNYDLENKNTHEKSYNPNKCHEKFWIKMKWLFKKKKYNINKFIIKQSDATSPSPWPMLVKPHFGLLCFTRSMLLSGFGHCGIELVRMEHTWLKDTFPVIWFIELTCLKDTFPSLGILSIRGYRTLSAVNGVLSIQG